MAYSDTIKYVVGDTMPLINITIKDSNTAAAGKTLDAQDSTTWAAINISTADVVRIHIRKVGSSTISTLNGTKVNSGTNGEATFEPLTTTFASAGTYEGEIELTYNGGSDVQTIYDLIKFTVRDDFN